MKARSITTHIACLLALFSLVLCAFFLSLLQLVKMLSQEADKTAGTTLPNMAVASYIGKESEWIKGILYESILCQDRFVHLGVVEEIAARRFPDAMLKRLDELVVEPGVKEKLTYNINELNEIIASANSIVSLRIDILRSTEFIVKRIRTLMMDVPQLEQAVVSSGRNRDGLVSFQAWKTAYSNISTAMLLLSMNLDRPYALRLKNEIRLNISRMVKITEQSPLLGDLKGISTDLAALALAEDGLLALYEERTALENRLETLKNAHQYTSNSLIESANDMSRQAWAGIQASQERLARRHAVIMVTVGTSFFLSIFLAFFIYRSIVTNVVAPIKLLNRCMLDRVKRIPAPFPEQVRYELAEMTSSVRHFISEIEKHERQLRHSHDNLEKQVVERTRDLKILSEKLLMAQEEERFKLAAELHDNIGATLGAIKFGMERSLRSARSLPLHELQPDICDTLSASISLVKKLAVHLRRIQNELRPPQLELGLTTTITDFCEEYERVFIHLPINLFISIDEKKLPPNLPIVIFRIIQEALSNIAKHSEATRVSISLSMDKALRLVISDNGKGFWVEEKLSDVSVKSGLGLKSLRERAQFSSGTLTIDSAPESGTVITVVWDGAALCGEG